MEREKQCNWLHESDEFIVTIKSPNEKSVCWFLINGRNRHSEGGPVSLCTLEIFHKLGVNTVQTLVRKKYRNTVSRHKCMA